MSDFQQPPAGPPGGAMPPYGTTPPPPGGFNGGNESKNNLGTWALVLGILGIVCCGIFTAIPAIIVGKKSQEAESQGLATNGQLGKIGVILGWVGVGLFALSLILNGVLLATGAVSLDTYGF